MTAETSLSAVCKALPASAATIEARNGNRPCRMQAVILGTADIDRIGRLHAQVVAQMPSGTVRPDPPEFFAHVLAGGGTILGYQTADDARLAAYGVLSLPAVDDDHYGKVLGMAPTEWPYLAQMEGAAVDPVWRGNGLHRRIVQWRLNLAARLHRRHIVATAAPANLASWQNLMAGGLAICRLTEMYGGHLRYVLYRRLDTTAALSPACEIDFADRQSQCRLFMQGWRAIGWTGGQMPATLLLAPEPEAV